VQSNETQYQYFCFQRHHLDTVWPVIFSNMFALPHYAMVAFFTDWIDDVAVKYFYGLDTSTDASIMYNV